MPGSWDSGFGIRLTDWSLRHILAFQINLFHAQDVVRPYMEVILLATDCQNAYYSA